MFDIWVYVIKTNLFKEYNKLNLMNCYAFMDNSQILQIRQWFRIFISQWSRVCATNLYKIKINT